jgi:MinD superfamily P-loop ATPase
MTEILVISGKGGTGKTSLTAALAHSAPVHILCDLDVDAPDMHLLMRPENEQAHEFWSGSEAVIDPAACNACGRCREVCRFNAVTETRDGYAIDPLRCEGCKTCVVLCPAQAIDFRIKQCGNWYVSRTRLNTTMVHAQLFPAEENSGRLVALLRKEAKTMAKDQGIDLIIADGPPGIGCPVISALSGVDLAVLVTEPTPSGRHDLERVVGLCGHFKTRMAAIINKWDLNPDQSRDIRHWCEEQGIPVVAQLPHDPAFVHAMVAGRTITEFTNDEIARRVRAAWLEIQSLVNPPGESNQGKSDR